MSAPISLFPRSVFAKSLFRKSLIELGKLASGTLVAFSLLMGSSQAAKAKTYQYRGLIDLDYGSSIIGAPKHSRYFVDINLDGSKLDTDNTVFENDLYNANGVRGLTTMGMFDRTLTSLRFTLDPTSVGTLSEINFDPDSSYARVVDANEPPPPSAPPCDVFSCIGEHITLSARDNTPGSPVTAVWLNLYNSNFYDPVYASRQLILDTSASGNPFSFEELFLHGPETLAEFRSYRSPNIVNYRDPVMMTGPGGAVASGRFLSLAYVPPGAPGPLPMLGVGAGLAWSRRLRSRLKARPQGAGLRRQGCDHPEGR